MRFIEESRMLVSSNLFCCLAVLLVATPAFSQWGRGKAKVSETTTVAPTTTTTTTTSTTFTAIPPELSSAHHDDSGDQSLSGTDRTTDATAGDGRRSSGYAECRMKDPVCGIFYVSPRPPCHSTSPCRVATSSMVLCSRGLLIRDSFAGIRVDGGWSDWSPAGSCSSECGIGWRHMIRTCTNPAPANDGVNCVGESHYIETCMAICNTPGVGSQPAYSPLQPMPPPGLPQQGMQSTPLPYDMPHVISTPHVQPPGYLPPPPTPPPLPMSSGSTMYDINRHIPPRNVVPIPLQTYYAPPRPAILLPLRPPPRPNNAPLQIAPGSILVWPVASAVREPQINSGYWAEWGQWSTCSRTCDPGESVRSRECRRNQSTDHCSGTNRQSKHCYMRSCPIPKDPSLVSAQPVAAGQWSGS